MIKPEDKFRLFCGNSFKLDKLSTLEKYRTQKWRLGKDYFYIHTYRPYSISKTTYYVELM